jgi:7,8-dihydroneopterin aldolase/epimerase/oxygenase
MDRIVIQDLTVFFHVGVPEEERARTQRLELTIEMDHDFSGVEDKLEGTIDYAAVSQCLLDYGQGRSWQLIETLAVELAEMILREFKPAAVTLEVKKFILPDARHVAVRVRRPIGHEIAGEPALSAPGGS